MGDGFEVGGECVGVEGIEVGEEGFVVGVVIVK